MARYGSSYSSQFGPGPLSPAVKLLLITNVVAWVLNLIVPSMTLYLGLSPQEVFTGFAFWQPFTCYSMGTARNLKPTVRVPRRVRPTER